MTFLATTTISVLNRETEKSPLDDEQYVDDLPIPGLVAIPFALKWKSKTVFLPESQEVRTIRYAVGRANPAKDIRKGDRILDERSQITYVIDERNAPGRGLAGHTDVTFDLRLLVAP